MKVEDLLVYGQTKIHKDTARILLAELLNKNPLELLNYLDEEVSEDKTNTYKEEITAITKGIPIQYVIGNVNFYGIKYYINKNVLIPRFETEELVENTIKYLNKYFNTPLDIIDLGCGSGVIGLTMEQKLNINTLDLVDISPDALEVAKKNKENLNSKANLIHNNFLNNINKKYDCIISNPPYIKTTEEIEDIVKDNEPHLALYAGTDGLGCYRNILQDINKNLKEKSLIAFEIDPTEKDAIIELAHKSIANIKILVKKDLSNRDRMIFIFKNININE